MPTADPFSPLREALAVSPTNVPLRLHLAEGLLGAGKADEFSGADLKAVVDRSVETKLREVMHTGIPTPLTTPDLLIAAKAIKPSTRELLADARNYAMYANDGGQYDDLAAYLKLR